MDFKQIEAFVNVVRYKSFSKAADATFFTQPTISTHIRNLEKELGVKLLDRKNRFVEMTPQGAKFYKYAVEMVNARAQAIDAISNNDANINGILEIQTSTIPGVTFLPKYLADFRAEHSGIQYYVSMSDTQTVIDNIIERRGEIGFVGDEVANHSITSVKLMSDKVVVISPKSYGLPNKVELSEIVGYPFIWRETGSATRKTFETAALSLGYDKEVFDIAGMFDDIASIIRAVEEGLGIAIISERMAATIGDKVSISEISDFSEPRDFYMIHLKTSSLSPAAEAFAGFVKKEFGHSSESSEETE